MKRSVNIEADNFNYTVTLESGIGVIGIAYVHSSMLERLMLLVTDWLNNIQTEKIVSRYFDLNIVWGS